MLIISTPTPILILVCILVLLHLLLLLSNQTINRFLSLLFCVRCLILIACFLVRCFCFLGWTQWLVDYHFLSFHLYENLAWFLLRGPLRDVQIFKFNLDK
jgi:hypothetical protein